MKRLLLFFLVTVCLHPINARIFTYEYEGQTLCYEVIDEIARTCQTSDLRFNDSKVAGDVVIPSVAKFNNIDYTVVSIGSRTFEYCDELVSVVIPNTVSTIQDEAFWSCVELKSVELPESIESIGREAFYYCYSLSSIEIPASVMTIGDYAFSGCESLVSVVIQNPAISLGTNVFGLHGRILKLAIPIELISYFENGYYSSIITFDVNDVTFEDGFIFNKDKTEIYFAPINLEGNYDLPSTVNIVHVGTFARCSNVTSIHLPNSITTIPENAFLECRNLAEINVPDNLTIIGNYSFSDCESLREFNLSDKVTSIGERAFSGCKGLTDFRIPDGIKIVEAFTFCGCSGLKNISIPNSVLKLEMMAFSGCSSLEAVHLPDQLLQTGEGAFSGCSNLTSISLPESFVSIGRETFKYCTNLKSVYLPGSLNEIGYESFLGCDALENIYYNTNDPIINSHYIFPDTVYANAVLHVPFEAVNTFKTRIPWAYFNNIEEYDFAGLEEFMQESDGSKEIILHDLNGAYMGSSVSNLGKGIYILQTGAVTKKIFIK